MDPQPNKRMHKLKIQCGRAYVDKKFRVASQIELKSVRNELECGSWLSNYRL
jgi:hypothetical protein